jgi:cytochrome c oxidase subunit 2
MSVLQLNKCVFCQVESHTGREGGSQDYEAVQSECRSLDIAPFLFPINFCHAQDATRSFEIHAKRFAFSPTEITVKKGETVKLMLTSDDVTHSLVIPDVNIKETITKGHTTEVTITPTKTGDFKGKCGHFCGSGHGSMILTVHVTDDQ